MTKPTHDLTEMLRLGSFPTRGCAPIHILTQPCPHTHMCHPQAFNHVVFPTLGPAYLLGRCWLAALGESPGDPSLCFTEAQRGTRLSGTESCGLGQLGQS